MKNQVLKNEKGERGNLRLLFDSCGDHSSSRFRVVPCREGISFPEMKILPEVRIVHQRELSAVPCKLRQLPKMKGEERKEDPEHMNIITLRKR